MVILPVERKQLSPSYGGDSPFRDEIISRIMNSKLIISYIFI
jgi:hypothetical protein